MGEDVGILANHGPARQDLGKLKGKWEEGGAFSWPLLATHTLSIPCPRLPAPVLLTIDKSTPLGGSTASRDSTPLLVPTHLASAK
jgi:hypothetical protein